LHFFYCYTGSTGDIGSTMQSAYVKTSLSLPADLFEYLKDKAEKNGGTPISRLIAQAIKKQKQNESRRAGK
jgi:metal-responsive CopG/Arc/MetJ family transcriptional regulator